MRNVMAGRDRPLVCLDAGHYGDYNHSPGNRNYVESRMAWKLHLLLKEELEKLGVRVITTRSDPEKDLDLKSRGLASKGCDLFISLHSNAVGNYMAENIDYVVIHRVVDRTDTDIDEKAAEIGAMLAPVIAQLMGTRQPWRVNTRNSEGDRDGNGRKDDNYYGVLNGAHLAGTPGIIVEHSFHTCTKSVDWLLQDTNLETLAVAEAAVIAEWFDVAKPAEPYVEPFVDVPESAYYAEAVRWAYGQGITLGRDETHFEPGTPVTRAEVVAMLHRALGGGSSEQ